MKQDHLFKDPPAGRLDKALAALLPAFSRARLQALISEGAVTVGGKPAQNAAQKLKGDEEIAISIPEAREALPEAQAIPLDIVFEDAHLLVINKPAGMVVHPAAGNHDATLVNALLAHCGASLSGIGGVRRPGIVHRLDKDTSGLMVVAKNDAAHNGLAAQFADHSLRRRYQALVWGLPMPPQGTIDTLIGRASPNRRKMTVIDPNKSRQNFYGEDVETEEPAQVPIWGEDDADLLPLPPEKGGRGKQAITHYEVLKGFGLTAAHVACVLETGRTHQIRVHMAHIGHGIIGDPLYGAAKGLQKKFDTLAEKKNAANPSPPVPLAAALIARQALHAAEIEFIHPASGEALHFEAPLPEDMATLLTMFAGF
jgi:23S rRNA pseudouridine1911/1915/1917 synthase